jgi:hypothetical protein
VGAQTNQNVELRPLSIMTNLDYDNPFLLLLLLLLISYNN